MIMICNLFVHAFLLQSQIRDSSTNAYTEIINPAETKQQNLYQEIVAHPNATPVRGDLDEPPQVVISDASERQTTLSNHSSRQGSTKKSDSGAQTPVSRAADSDTQLSLSQSSPRNANELKRKTSLAKRLKSWLKT